MILRKLLAVLICFTLVMTLFAGCGQKGTEKETSSGQETTKEETKKAEEVKETKKEAVTLQLVKFKGDEAENKAMNQVIEMFEKANPEIKVEMEVFATSADFYPVIKPRLLAGAGVDIFSLHAGAVFKEYYNAGYLKELTGLKVIDELMPSFLETSKADGKVYMLPFTFGGQSGVWYNKEIFKQFGLQEPKTWDEFISIIKTLNQKKITPIAGGFADVFSLWWLVEGFLMNEGAGNMITAKLEKGEKKLTDPEFLEMALMWRELADNNAFQKDVEGTKYAQSSALFTQKKAAMLNAGTWLAGSLRTQAPDMDFGYLLIPGKNGKNIPLANPGMHFGVNSKTTNAEQALKFMEFFFSKDSLSVYANTTGQFTTRKDVELTNPDLKELAKVFLTPDTSLSPGAYHSTAKIHTEILPKIAYRAYMKEDIQKVLKEGQAELEKSIAK